MLIEVRMTEFKSIQLILNRLNASMRHRAFFLLDFPHCSMSVVAQAVESRD